MYLKIHTNSRTQSDYPDGCVEIVTTGVKESFELGLFAGNLFAENYEAVQISSNGDHVSVRIPLQKRTEHEKNRHEDI